jgi:hypothetical protein
LGIGNTQAAFERWHARLFNRASNNAKLAVLAIEKYHENSVSNGSPV